MVKRNAQKNVTVNPYPFGLIFKSDRVKNQGFSF
jgi:hypothetical protein